MIKSPLKWVGGKTRVLDLISRHIPNDFCNYHEPFLGSGAVFIFLKQTLPEEREWYLSDTNCHLICWWQAVQNSLVALVHSLRELKQQYEAGDHKRVYYEIRQSFNEYTELDAHKAAMFMFLCRTAFNGLVRYNTKGHFNSAWGNQRTGIHKDAFIIDENHLENLSYLLQGNVKIKCCHYETTRPKAGDFVFMDPPYVPASGDRKLDDLAYAQGGFDLKDQERFARWCCSLKDEVELMVCNHDTDFVRGLFPNFEFHPYDLVKHFSGSGKSRKSTTEVLITNYQ